MSTARNPDTIHAPIGRYVHQIEVTEPSKVLFISGQVGRRADGSVPDDASEQFVVALQNVLANLTAAGLETKDLTKMTVYAVGALDPVGRREALERMLGEHVACSTLIYVAALAAPQYKVELDAWAAA
ncbi:MAG TPA: RidA family protein [Candidatus Limnocylindria bacterium]|nr:RidA family protein [Candidatus Limnocylindria bacterium]